MGTRQYEIREGSSAWFTIKFYDKDGFLAAPTAISYNIKNLADGAAVRGDTPIGAASEVELHITPSDTAIIDDTKQWETKRITIEADYGIDDAFNDEIDYHVKNLSYIP